MPLIIYMDFVFVIFLSTHTWFLRRVVWNLVNSRMPWPRACACKGILAWFSHDPMTHIDIFVLSLGTLFNMGLVVLQYIDFSIYMHQNSVVIPVLSVFFYVYVSSSVVLSLGFTSCSSGHKIEGDVHALLNRWERWDSLLLIDWNIFPIISAGKVWEPNGDKKYAQRFRSIGLQGIW